MELLLFVFDVLFRIIDAEIVGVNACFDFSYLVELLGHRISYIEFTVKLREVCIEDLEDCWLAVFRRLRLDDEFLESLEASIIEFELSSVIQQATECCWLQTVCRMEVLVVY